MRMESDEGWRKNLKIRGLFSPLEGERARLRALHYKKLLLVTAVISSLFLHAILKGTNRPKNTLMEYTIVEGRVQSLFSKHF